MQNDTKWQIAFLFVVFFFLTFFVIFPWTLPFVNCAFFRWIIRRDRNSNFLRPIYLNWIRSEYSEHIKNGAAFWVQRAIAELGTLCYDYYIIDFLFLLLFLLVGLPVVDCWQIITGNEIECVLLLPWKWTKDNILFICFGFN